ncbi:unnamed protein product, partial [Staurois parvus]
PRPLHHDQQRHHQPPPTSQSTGCHPRLQSVLPAPCPITIPPPVYPEYCGQTHPPYQPLRICQSLHWLRLVSSTPLCQSLHWLPLSVLHPYLPIPPLASIQCPPPLSAN